MIYKWKICVLGDPSVGKTSLIRHYCEGFFRENYLSTIGVSFLRKSLKLEFREHEYDVVLQLWDIGGQSIFSAVRKTYLHGSNAALILFDLTEKITLSHVPDWFNDVRRYSGNIPVLVIGNKADLPYNPRIVDKAEAICKRLGVEFFITSAKTGENMNEIFEYIARKLLEIAISQ